MNMNRFESYLHAKRLSRLHLQQAQIDLQKGNDKRAIQNVIGALTNYTGALNCLASLFFEPRKKYRRKK